MTKLRVLAIEDEPAIVRLLRAGLQDCDVTEAPNSREGLRAIATEAPDVVLLDLGLPDQSGLETLAELRTWSHVPVIVLTARGQERDKVAALDSGADDYVTKPFSLNELMARIRVAARHARAKSTSQQALFESRGLKVDFGSRRAFLNDDEVRLTRIEFRLLSLLASHAGLVLTHRQLILQTWGEDYPESIHSLRVHMASIRRKIERDPSRPSFIRTETGVGYRLMV